MVLIESILFGMFRVLQKIPWPFKTLPHCITSFHLRPPTVCPKLAPLSVRATFEARLGSAAIINGASMCQWTRQWTRYQWLMEHTVCCHMQTHAARERVYLSHTLPYPTQMLHATPTRCSAANPRGLFTACHNMITIILCIFQKNVMHIWGHAQRQQQQQRKKNNSSSERKRNWLSALRKPLSCIPLSPTPSSPPSVGCFLSPRVPLCRLPRCLLPVLNIKYNITKI